MSTRWYPLYRQGNPQLRIFLPNFWMKLIRSPETQTKQPDNIVQFIVSTEMTRYDIKNYLEKIYNVPVVKVNTRIATGEFRRQQLQGCVIKDDDYKVAYVTLPKDCKFEFPETFPTDDRAASDEKTLDEAKKAFGKFIEKGKDRPGVPGWFSF